MENPKKKNKRNSTKYPALKPELNLKSRYEQIDYDYISKLNDEEKKFLNSFTEEFINANFTHDGVRIHPKKEVYKKRAGKTIKRDMAKKESEDKNNARNRDVMTKLKSAGQMLYVEELSEENNPKSLGENDILSQIDNKNNIKLIVEKLKELSSQNLELKDMIAQLKEYTKDCINVTDLNLYELNEKEFSKAIKNFIIFHLK